MSNPIPRMMRLRQNFPKPAALDIPATLRAEFVKVRTQIKPGARIAVGVGSRGITNLPEIVAAVIEELKSAGARPFIIPAMGSHGGATPDGQRDVLATYGITAEAMKVPVHPSLEVEQVGITADGVPVMCCVEALRADGVVLINRIKPHTDFIGTLGSGIIKMAVVGLGKRTGAATMHVAASRLGHERVIRAIGHVILEKAPIVCGVAILENQFHDTAKLVVLPREEIETAEGQLLIEARNLMPLLPFDEIDLLIIDRLGKNISGAGMDPNVTGRWVQGYSGSLAREGRASPFIRRIFVRDLTPETHGNAIGIGLADVTTSRLVRGMDNRVTYINSLTSLTPQCSKIPIYFETDREAIDLTLTSLAVPDTRAARIVRIQDTLLITGLEVSENLQDEIRQKTNLTVTSDPAEMIFDPDGNLVAM